MNGKHITKLGFEGKAVGLALSAAGLREDAGVSRGDILDELRSVQNYPEQYLGGGVYADLATHLIEQQAAQQTRQSAKLRAAPLPYRTWGEDLIEPGAHRQMDVAMQLPISRAGALMPDAHVGYGLPIGGVLATENAVIPYGVGVDIGCSMMLSVFPVAATGLSVDEARSLLLKHTRFGAGVGFEKRDRLDHPVLAEATWDEQPLLRHLFDKAATQIGTSGSGNHFVEFGTFTLAQADPQLEGHGEDRGPDAVHRDHGDPRPQPDHAGHPPHRPHDRRDLPGHRPARGRGSLRFHPLTGRGGPPSPLGR